MVVINLIQKEVVILELTIKDKDTGAILDVSSATITLYCKDVLDDSTTYQFTIADGSIDKTQGASGIIQVPLSSTNLDWYGTKYCILKIQFSPTNVRKGYFKLELTQSPE